MPKSKQEVSLFGYICAHILLLVFLLIVLLFNLQEGGRDDGHHTISSFYVCLLLCLLPFEVCMVDSPGGNVMCNGIASAQLPENCLSLS